MSQTLPPASSADLSDRLFSLYRAVASGSMALSHALGVARELPLHSDLGEDGLYPMANGVVGAARSGQLKAASLQWRLVLEAMDHALTERQRDAAAEASRAWLYIATYYLLQRPDGRVLSDARRRGEQRVDALIAADTQADAAAILHDLGVVLSEPYISGRDQRNFAAQIANWLAQGRSNLIDLELAGPTEMPAPGDALMDAAAMFRRAADLRSGRQRGASLKALSDAIIWHSVAGGPLDRPYLSAVIAEAWQLLDPSADHVIYGMLAQNAEALGISLPDRPGPGAADATDLERLKGHDPHGYIHAITVLANNATRPRDAIAHLLAGVQFAADTGDEEARVRLMLHVAARAISLFDLRAAAPHGDAPTGEWEDAVDAQMTRADAERWSTVDQALASLGLAVLASEANREDVAVPLVGKALALDMSAAAGLALAMSTALAQLSWYQAATHYEANRFLDACAQYLRASDIAARLGMTGLARRNFERALDAFRELPDIADPQVVATAALSLPRLQSDVPGLAPEIRRFWLSVISHAAFTTQREDVLSVALQAAKGASLPVARAAHGQGNVLERPVVQQAVGNWEAASSRTIDAPGVYDEEKLLVAYSDSLEQPGRTPAEQVANLARRLDRTLASELAKWAPSEADTALSADALRALVPTGTVLVSVYPCFTEQRKVAYVALLATHEEVVVRRARGTLPFMEIEIDHISTDDLAGVVSGLRTRLLGGAAANDLVGELERGFESLLGAVEDDLAALHRRGYRHLCINPHGAAHFCPLPLLGRGSRPLADDWIVTHLPAIGLLASAHHAGSAPRSGAGIFALSFDDARTGLAPLPAAADEARRIGKALGTTPTLDRDATVPRFEKALRTARWVHVATHGRHDPAAPALQTLYLHSGRRDVVPYRAFRVLEHRLEGLDLVTLSACESALGRIDMNDNPRGLQSFLFTAGAATIVSCLWPVGDEVAAVFFERLYEELAAGRSKLDAFAAAQRTVRDQYQNLIDWGAFHYSGAW